MSTSERSVQPMEETMCEPLGVKIPDMKEEEDSTDEPPLSPIVGYIFYSDEGEDTSTSEEDPVIDEYVKAVNARIAEIANRGVEMEPTPTTPRSEKRKRMRKRMFRARRKEAQADLVKRQKLSFEEYKEDIKGLEHKRAEANRMKIAMDSPVFKEIEAELDILDSPGFMTASGNFVPVSREALEIVENVRKSQEAADAVSVLKDPSPELSDPLGFSTSASREAIEMVESIRKSQEAADAAYTMNKIFPSLGFTTAGGKPLTVSKKALDFAGHLYKSVEAADDGPIFKADPPGFKIAHKKIVAVSNKALDYAGHMYKSVEAEDDAPLFKADPPGFKIAHKKIVAVSNKALDYAGHMYKSVEAEDDAPLFKADPPGFKIANKRIVPVSNKALDYAGHMYKSVEAADDAPLFKADPPGFKTANKRIVHVSNKALDFAGHMYKSVEAADDAPVVKADPPGFRTTSKKFIPVSKKSVEKVTSIFQGIEDDTKVPEKIYRPGFTTGNGRFVPVSQKALKAVRGLQKDQPTTEKAGPSGCQKVPSNAVGEMTQEINDCIMAFLADDEDDDFV